MHTRKPNRSQAFDYASNKQYFVTICTKNKYELFGRIVDSKMLLSKIGEFVVCEIANISYACENVLVHSSVIMPNHVHMIIEIQNACRGDIL